MNQILLFCLFLCLVESKSVFSLTKQYVVDMVSVIGSDVKSGFNVCNSFAKSAFMKPVDGQILEKPSYDSVLEEPSYDSVLEESSHIEEIEFIFDDEISEKIVVNEDIEWIIEEASSEYIEDTSFVLFIVEPPVNEVRYHSNQLFGPETEEFHRFVYGYESEYDM
jgi:hypothetical protein